MSIDRANTPAVNNTDRGMTGRFALLRLASPDPLLGGGVGVGELLFDLNLCVPPDNDSPPRARARYVRRRG